MRRLKIFPVIVLIISFSIYTPVQVVQGERQPEMLVHFIDVGQGDSMLIQTPHDKNILIDGGPPDAGDKVVSYLEKLKIDKIDLLVATHPDIDHIGGLPQVMKSFHIDQVLDTGKLHTTKTFVNYISEIRKQEIPVQIAQENQQIELDPLLDIKVLNSYGKFKTNNQSSIALKITYQDIDFLLMSDVEKAQEEALLKQKELQSEFIKIAHHGSKTSTSLEFLQEVKPQIGILTYSVQNRYGHPVNRVIENLYKVNAEIYSTAVFGNIIVTTNGEDYFVVPERRPIENLYKGAG
ncbi:ComEC/Rec2 family competence protein [Virgibacillus ainsalahensis]